MISRFNISNCDYNQWLVALIFLLWLPEINIFINPNYNYQRLVSLLFLIVITSLLIIPNCDYQRLVSLLFLIVIISNQSFPSFLIVITSDQSL